MHERASRAPRRARPHRHRARLAFLLALAAAMAGCLDWLPQGLEPRPDYAVARTPVLTGPGAWNKDSTFVVQVNEPQPLQVDIVADPAGPGAPLTASGLSSGGSSVSLEIPDGTWTISYSVDGYDWEEFRNARFDGTPPTIAGLESFGETPGSAACPCSYTLGPGALVEPGASVEVVDQATGQEVANALPAALTGLDDGVHAFDVAATDPAGNQAVWTVQVVAGSATRLPDGQLTMGIVARYRTAAALWDLSDLDRYLSPAAARD